MQWITNQQVINFFYVSVFKKISFFLKKKRKNQHLLDGDDDGDSIYTNLQLLMDVNH